MAVLKRKNNEVDKWNNRDSRNGCFEKSRVTKYCAEIDRVGASITRWGVENKTSNKFHKIIVYCHQKSKKGEGL